MNLDELDRAYWEHVEQQVDPEGAGELGFVELAPDVDRSLWREFASGHLAAADFLPATYGITLSTRGPARRPSWYLALSIAFALLTLVGGAATLIADTWLTCHSR